MMQKTGETMKVAAKTTGVAVTTAAITTGVAVKKGWATTSQKVNTAVENNQTLKNAKE